MFYIYQNVSKFPIDCCVEIDYHFDMDLDQVSNTKTVYKRYKLVDDFGDYLRAGNKYSQNTIKNYLSDIRHFFGYLNMYFTDDFTSMNISPQIIFQYKQSMLLVNTSNITIKRRLSSINRFIEFLASNNIQNTQYHNDIAINNIDAPQQVRTHSSPLNTLLSQYIYETKASSESRRRISEFLQFSDK